MIFYFTFVISIMVCIGLLYLIRTNPKEGKTYKKRTNRVFLLGFAILFIIMMGLRSVSVGADTENYNQIFEHLGRAQLSEKVPVSIDGYFVYRIICRIIYELFNGSYRIMLIFCATVTVSSIFMLIRDTSDNYFMSVILFLLTNTYFISWNAARQYLAMAVAIIAIRMFYKKKMWLALLLFALACGIHNTVIVMMIFVPLKYIKWNKIKFLVFSGLSFLGCVVVNKYIPILLSFFPRYSALYARAWARQDFSSFGGTSQGRKVILSLFYLMIIIIFLMISNIEESNITQKKEISDWVILSAVMMEIIIGVVFQHNSMMLRFQMYFTTFVIIGIPNMIEKIKTREIYRFIIYLLISLIMLIPLFVQISENYGRIVPYKFM